MRNKILFICFSLLLLGIFISSSGCGGIFNSGGCTRGGYLSGTRVRVTELIETTGCQTLPCPRIVSYEVTANNNGVISYRRDENGNCLSYKLSFTIVGFNLTSFTNLSGSIDLTAPPPYITIGGSGIDTTYGNPMVHLYDYRGVMVGAAVADSVGKNNSSATFNLPTLTNPYSGTYQARIANKMWDGNYQEIGVAPIDCYGMPLVDVDQDGFYCDTDCNDNDANINPLASPDCTGYLWDANCNGMDDTTEYECTGGGGNCCGPGCYCW